MHSFCTLPFWKQKTGMSFTWNVLDPGNRMEREFPSTPPFLSTWEKWKRGEPRKSTHMISAHLPVKLGDAASFLWQMAAGSYTIQSACSQADQHQRDWTSLSLTSVQNRRNQHRPFVRNTVLLFKRRVFQLASVLSSRAVEQILLTTQRRRRRKSSQS